MSCRAWCRLRSRTRCQVCLPIQYSAAHAPSPSRIQSKGCRARPLLTRWPQKMRDLIVLAVLIAFFLVVRRFWWWYLGIDRMVAALESIDQSLKYLPGVRAERQRCVNCALKLSARQIGRTVDKEKRSAQAAPLLSRHQNKYSGRQTGARG